MTASCSKCGEPLLGDASGELCSKCSANFAVNLAHLGDDSSLCDHTMDGQSIAHYEVTGKLGEGGMGEVYRARDTKLGRAVAIKILPDGMARNAQVLSRFEREAKMLATLNHPNIATIHGIEDVDGSKAIAMELVEGDTLGERLQKGALSVDECLPVFRQIASALEAAHEKGIIHRDLKPGNIKFTADGQVKVLDFGLAKPTTEASEVDMEANTLMAETTMPGTVLGTPAYMSPEQTRGDAVDKRTDVWAFGCCLYESLTGRKPFKARTISDMMAEVLKSDPDFTLVPTETPNDILSLLRRCLEKEPRRRLRDIGDIAIRLEETTETSRMMPVPVATAEKPTKKPPSSILLKLVAVLAVFGLGAVLSSIWSPDPVVDSAPIKSIAILPFENRNEDGDEGLAEEIADGVWEKLWAIKGLVAKRIRIPLETYLEDGKSSSEVAAEHQVDALVVGSLREQAGSYLVRARLIRGVDGQDVPLGKVEESVDEPARLESQVALAIAEKIRSDLSNDQQDQILANQDIDPLAFEAFRKGQADYDSWNFASALTHFGEALTIKSDYVDALILTGGSVLLSGISQEEPGKSLSPQEARDEARSWVQKALALDPTNASAYSVRGLLEMFDGAFVKAKADLNRAKELAPNDPVNNLRRGVFLKDVEGRYEEAADATDRSLAVDPHRSLLIWSRAHLDLALGHFDQALERLSTVPRSPIVCSFEAWALLKLGRLDEAEQRALEAANLSNRDPGSLSLLARIHIAKENTEKARALLEEMEQFAEKRDRPQLAIALVYAALKEWESAFYWLERVIEEKPAHELINAHGPDIIDLFGYQARYWELIQRAGFPELPIGHPFWDEEQKVRSASVADSRKSIRKIAVLPFTSITSQEDQAYFADAMTVLLTTKLGKIPELTVIAGRSTSQFKDSDDTIPEISRKLKVDALVEGDVIRLGDQVVITAKLVNGSGEIEWTDTFSDSVDGLDSLHFRVISEIAESVSVTITPEKATALSKSGTESRKALEYYLKGVAQKGSSKEAFQKQLHFAKEAISEDPNYASAYILKASALVYLLYWGFEEGDEPVGQLRSALTQILAVDPGLPEAHTVAGAIALFIDRDFVSAEQRLSEAVKLASNNTVSLEFYATILGILGRHPESIEHMRMAQDLDPLSVQVGAGVAWAYFRSGDYAQALEASEAVIRLDESSFMGFHCKAFALIGLGKDVEAEKNFRLAYEKSGRAPFYLARLGYGLGVLGKKGEAAELLGQLEGIAQTEPEKVTPYHFGLLYLGLGEDDKAVAWFEKACEEGDMPVIYLGSNFLWDAERKPLRDNPKYQPLLRRIGLLE